MSTRTARADQPALGFFAEDGGRNCRWLTFAELFGRVVEVAAGLAGHGLAKGRVCLLVLPSGAFCAEVLLAVLQRGAVPLLIAAPTMKRLDERLLGVLQHIVGSTDAVVMICPLWMREHRERLAGLGQGLRVLCGEDEVRQAAAKVPPWEMPAADALGAMQLTSGTTGAPRICMWQQSSILAALDGMTSVMQLRDGDVCCNWTPLYHDMGLVNNFLLCLSTGVPLVMLSPHRFVGKPALWLQALSDTASTVTWAPNFGYAVTAERVEDADLDNVRLEAVRAFWNAAERIHADTFERFHARFAHLGVAGTALKANFGCAENVGGATFSAPGRAYVVERVDAALLHAEGIAQVVDDAHDGATETFVGCGGATPGSRVHILSGTGEELPDGQVGEVALKTPSRFLGYLGDDVSTRRALHGDLLRTGDLGYRRGEELFWTGRTDERLTLRGRKFDPSDFEASLGAVEGLRQGCFAVFDVFSAVEGTQAVVLICEVRASSSRPAPDIRRDIRERIALAFGIPVHEVLLVPERSLAKTTSGKRRHLHYKSIYRDHGTAGFETL